VTRYSWKSASVRMREDIGVIVAVTAKKAAYVLCFHGASWNCALPLNGVMPHRIEYEEAQQAHDDQD